MLTGALGGKIMLDRMILKKHLLMTTMMMIQAPTTKKAGMTVVEMLVSMMEKMVRLMMEHMITVEMKQPDIRLILMGS
jgi:hypothetical protein